MKPKQTLDRPPKTTRLIPDDSYQDLALPPVYWHTTLGVSITEAASLDHHVIQSIVIFVHRVPATPTQQSVAKCKESSKVHTKISQRDLI